MKSIKQTEREAKHLFRLCHVSGSLDERRVREILERVLKSGRLIIENRLDQFIVDHVS